MYFTRFVVLLKFMSTLIVSEVSTLLYAYGIPNVHITKIIMIEIFPEKQRKGERPFSESLLLARTLAHFMGLDFETYSISETESGTEVVKKLLHSDSIVELSIISYFRISKRLRKGCLIISGSSEHAFINFPSIIKGMSPELKQRIEMQRRIFIPLKIYRFYSLGSTERNFHLIKAKGINLEKFLGYKTEWW